MSVRSISSHHMPTIFSHPYHLPYPQPERIQGAQYTVKSDVWSLGISLIELALGRFPFSESSSDDSDLSDLEGTLSPARPGSIALAGLPARRARRGTPSTQTSKKDKRKSKGVSLQGGGMTMSILELLQHIVNEPAPRLTPEGRFPREAEAFVDSCLLKDPDERGTPKDLLVSFLALSIYIYIYICTGCFVHVFLFTLVPGSVERRMDRIRQSINRRP